MWPPYCALSPSLLLLTYDTVQTTVLGTVPSVIHLRHFTHIASVVCYFLSPSNLASDSNFTYFFSDISAF
jgi:hypothetical protein